MQLTRRSALSYFSGITVGFSGCISGNPANSDRSTPSPTDSDAEDGGINDIHVFNERDTTVSVEIVASTESSTPFENAFELSAGETRVFEDPLEDSKSYDISTVVDGTLTKNFEWTPERGDVSGVSIFIYPDNIEVNYRVA